MYGGRNLGITVWDFSPLKTGLAPMGIMRLYSSPPDVSEEVKRNSLANPHPHPPPPTDEIDISILSNEKSQGAISAHYSQLMSMGDTTWRTILGIGDRSTLKNISAAALLPEGHN